MKEASMSQRTNPSSEHQDAELPVAAQLRALRNFADKHGRLVVREYVDEAISSSVAHPPR